MRTRTKVASLFSGMGFTRALDSSSFTFVLQLTSIYFPITTLYFGSTQTNLIPSINNLHELGLVKVGWLVEINGSGSGQIHMSSNWVNLTWADSLPSLVGLYNGILLVFMGWFHLLFLSLKHLILFLPIMLLLTRSWILKPARLPILFSNTLNWIC